MARMSCSLGFTPTDGLKSSAFGTPTRGWAWSRASTWVSRPGESWRLPTLESRNPQDAQIVPPESDTAPKERALAGSVRARPAQSAHIHAEGPPSPKGEKASDLLPY